MKTPSNKPGSGATAPAEPRVSFFRTEEGHLAALVNRTGYLQLPSADGRGFRVLCLDRPGTTPNDWRPNRGFTIAHVPDETAFRAYVEEQAAHDHQLDVLARVGIANGAPTPWGPAQTSRQYAEGVVFHSTASHGGFHLDPERNAAVHPKLRSDDGWYEEDCCWAAVAQAFPELFTDFEWRCAATTIRNHEPDAWEAIQGCLLLPGESHEKDRRAVMSRHAANWIVVSAINSAHEKGFVEVVATLGGRRGPGTEERRFLIPAHEYQIGRFGFVVDEARHRLYGGPSSFIGWGR